MEILGSLLDWGFEYDCGGLGHVLGSFPTSHLERNRGPLQKRGSRSECSDFGTQPEDRTPRRTHIFLSVVNVVAHIGAHLTFSRTCVWLKNSQELCCPFAHLKSHPLTSCFTDHPSTCLTHFHHFVPRHVLRHPQHCLWLESGDPWATPPGGLLLGHLAESSLLTQPVRAGHKEHSSWCIQTFEFNKIPRTSHPCIVEAHESTRQRVESSLPQDHGDHIVGRGYNSMTHYNLAHKFIPMPQAMRILDAKAALDNMNGRSSKRIKAWQLDSVKSRKEVILEA